MFGDKQENGEQNDFSIPGFVAAATASGLKKDGALDLGLLFSECEATAAGVFTNNLVKAAPVLLSRKHVETGTARAILANGGNANACTGREGYANAVSSAHRVAEALGIPLEQVLVASTGVIGEPLKMECIERGVGRLIRVLSREGIGEFARAIMTTDSFPKIAQTTGEAGGCPYRVLGVAKGAGMIMPNMATMLCFVLSDISVPLAIFKESLFAVTEHTFNRISVDGDTSTNDTVLAMANGKAGNGPMSREDVKVFQGCLERVMGELARMIARDGEGATKLVHIEVLGAATPSEAIQAARTVANSSLVKTAFYGADPNWGRVMAALGRAGIRMEPDKVDLWVGNVKIVSNGLAVGKEAEGLAARKMGDKEFTLKIHLNMGPFHDRMTTCDLTHDYVSINANYRT